MNIVLLSNSNEVMLGLFCAVEMINERAKYKQSEYLQHNSLMCLTSIHSIHNGSAGEGLLLSLRKALYCPIRLHTQ